MPVASESDDPGRLPVSLGGADLLELGSETSELSPSHCRRARRRPALVARTGAVIACPVRCRRVFARGCRRTALVAGPRLSPARGCRRPVVFASGFHRPAARVVADRD